MASPFDQLLNLKIEDQNEAVRTAKTVPESHVATQKNIPFTDKTISLSVHGRTLERFLYLIVILSLVSYIVYDSYTSTPMAQLSGIQEISGNAVQTTTEVKVTTSSKTPVVPETIENKPDASQTLALAVTNNSASKSANTTEEAQPVIETPSSTAKPVIKDFNTNFDLIIKDVLYTSDNTTKKPSGMKSMTLTVNNRWKTFRPRLEVYWYDSGANDVIKNKIRANVQLSTIKEGDFQFVTIDSFDSTFFSPFLPEETIVVKLYNTETGMMMKEVEYTIR